MAEIVALVEGETEQTFVRDQLAAHLALNGSTIWPVLPGRQRRHGGVKKWEVARQDIFRLLRAGRYCTTMFDFYAMPNDWPGRNAASTLPWQTRASYVGAAMLADVTAAMSGSFNPAQFLPYVQLHEFEALAFADVEKLASVVSALGNWSPARVAKQFSDILEASGDPEAINDGYDTCPSRRISTIVPAFRKRVHSPIVTARIGIAALRVRCRHFASWLASLESLGQQV